MKRMTVIALAAALCLTGNVYAEETKEPEAGGEAVSESPAETAENETGEEEAVDETAEKADEEDAEDSKEMTTISVDEFSVKVPSDLLEICDIKKYDRQIAFYEKIANSAFGGGFVGSICLYENVADYGTMPSYSRGGEIDYPDGKKLDVVLLFPTDVQVDMDNEESKDNYSRIGEEFKKFSAELIPSGDGVLVPQDQVDTTGIYDEIIEKLSSDLRERKDQDALEADGFSYMYTHFYDSEDGKDPLDEIGYAYVDVNLDGYSELVIGSVGSNFIEDMYVPVDGKPVHLFSGGERSSYTLNGHSPESFLYICNSASGSAAYSEVNFYILESNKSDMNLQVGFVFDAEKDEEKPWFISYSSSEEPEPAEEEAWNERMTNFGEVIDPGFTALSGK